MYKYINNCNSSIQLENKQKIYKNIKKSIDKLKVLRYNKAKIRDEKTIKLLKKKETKEEEQKIKRRRYGPPERVV